MGGKLTREEVLARLRELVAKGESFTGVSRDLKCSRTWLYTLLTPGDRRRMLKLGTRNQQRAKAKTVEQYLADGKIAFAKISRLCQVSKSTVSRLAAKQIDAPSPEDTEELTFRTRRTRRHPCPTCGLPIEFEDCLVCHLARLSRNNDRAG